MEDTLGKRIAAKRKQLGLTQDQLAEKLGVTAQAVSKWENDQSCPDISILPKLAQIFSVTTDVLLGCAPAVEPVCEAQIVDDPEPDEGHAHKGTWEFSLGHGTYKSLPFAILVILSGILYLIAQLQRWDLSFWDLLWPSAFLVFGLFGLLRKFSFVNLGSVFIGIFYLTDKLIPTGLDFDGGMVFAVIIVLLGISLLIDSLRKKKNRKVHMHWNWEPEHKKRGRQTNDIVFGENSFAYNASFGEGYQCINLPVLSTGQVSTSFGEYTIDLSGVESVSEDCALDVSCSFGELTLNIPRRFAVKPASSTSFAAFSVDNQPDPNTVGSIQLDVSVSFGEVRVRYI